MGIFVGGDGTPVSLLPRNIAVVNNTAISGLSNSLRFGRAYASLPLGASGRWSSTTPASAWSACAIASAAGTTCSAFGEACTPTDAIGNPHLDANGAPTAASALLIDRGDASVAPPIDFFGYARTVGVPDIGAIEFGASAAPLPPKAHARARLVSLKVRRGLRRWSCSCAPPMPRASR